MVDADVVLIRVKGAVAVGNVVRGVHGVGVAGIGKRIQREKSLRDRTDAARGNLIIRERLAGGWIFDHDPGPGEIAIAQRLRGNFVLDCLTAREAETLVAVSYTHLRAHETPEHLVCR